MSSLRPPPASRNRRPPSAVGSTSFSLASTPTVPESVVSISFRHFIYRRRFVQTLSYNRGPALGIVVAVALLMLLSSSLVAGSTASSTGALPSSAVGGPAPTASNASEAANLLTQTNPTCGLTTGANAPLLTAANDPTWAGFIQHTKTVASNAVSAGLPVKDLHLPYIGPYPDQKINGMPETGEQIAAECPDNNATDPAPAPSGVAYDGQSYRGTHLVNDPTIDSNSLLGVLNVTSINNFYPDSATPTLWGGQLNAVLANVTILGQRGYAFWVQNVISYDSHNDTISFVDDTWNFTTFSSEMEPSSLVSWSPNGSDYTGTWVAFSQYLLRPAPLHGVRVRQLVREFRGGSSTLVQL